MSKPTIYVETSVVSSFWYDGADVAMLARRLRTREWWEEERRHFAISTSAFAEAELRAGKFPRQPECLKMVRRLQYLTVTSAVRMLLEEILRCKIVPANKAADAAHLAIAAIHGVDYLLTWNYAHMANPFVQARLDRLCEPGGHTSPLLVSPESIPQVRFGLPVRRRK